MIPGVRLSSFLRGCLSTSETPLLSYLGSLVSSQSYHTGRHKWLTLMYASQSCASHSLPHRASSTLGCLLPSAYVFVLDDSTPHLSGFLLVISLALSCRRLQLLRLLRLRATDTSGITPLAPRPLAFFPGDIKATPLHLPRTDHIGLSTYPHDLDQVTDTESHSLTPATTSSHFQVIHPLLPSCTSLVHMDHG